VVKYAFVLAQARIMRAACRAPRANAC